MENSELRLHIAALNGLFHSEAVKQRNKDTEGNGCFFIASILPIPAQSDALLRLRAFNTESRPSPQAALSIAGRQMALWGRQEVGRLPARSYTAKRAGSGARNRAALPGARRGGCGEGAAGNGGGGTGGFTQQEWGCTEPREHPDPMLEEQKAGSALTPIPLAGHPAPEATTTPPVDGCESSEIP